MNSACHRQADRNEEECDWQLMMVKVTEVVCLGAVGAAEVFAEFGVRHVVSPRAALLVTDGEAEALRAEGEVVQGQLRLGPERVRPDDQHVVPETDREHL